MFSIPSSLCEVGGCSSDSYNINVGEGVVAMMSSATDHDENGSNLSPRSMAAEAKAAATSNSHKEAERRRRKRINAHIATLKSILPNVIKTDKASLLGETVRRVRELKKAAGDIMAAAETEETGGGGDSTSKIMFPSETDELKVCECDNSGLTKATVCCEDRPEMVVELIRALKSVEAKVVRAEMSTVGGRTKTVLWVRLGGVGSDSDSDVGLRRALKMVMDKSVSGPESCKRARYYHHL